MIQSMKILYIHDRSAKKKPSRSKRLQQVLLDHQKFLASVGYTGSKPKTSKKLTVVATKVRPVEERTLQEIVAPCLKRDIFERTRNESDDVKEAIRQKAARTAPAYNKGALQYITDGDNLKTLGRKV